MTAAYAFGLARSDPYRDGNKRTAFLVAVIFLGLNGFELEVPQAEVVAAMLDLADGGLSEATLAQWIRRHLIPCPEF